MKSNDLFGHIDSQDPEKLLINSGPNTGEHVLMPESVALVLTSMMNPDLNS